MDDSKFRSQIEVLSVVDKGRRREWTDSEKVRIVEESLRGFRQCSATARRHGISRALLTRWRRDFRAGQLASERRPQFLAVEVASEMSAKSVPPSVLGSGADRGDRIEITLGNGRKLAVGVTIDPMVLARLVQVLDRA
ncbi:IS66-like element accessory protein TnpA [Stagnihabitans tardus]|uniref:Transposase n=1 Tax=Stagnihabitans tardus TaxID=2699202 RepID=A0AAE4YHU7_9RHOB|nr:transposase [Stagnihabitans tardus]NBZ90120.1 transposase [Stagnihabitans tardus]